MKNNNTTDAATARLTIATSKLVAARADFARSYDEADLDERAADYDSGKRRIASAMRLAGTGVGAAFWAADAEARTAYTEALDYVVDHLVD